MRIDKLELRRATLIALGVALGCAAPALAQTPEAAAYDSALFKKPDDELLSLYRADLESLFPEAGRTVVDQFLFRAPFVEPIWKLNYRRLAPPTSVIPGRLYLACTAQVYPHVNSWNSCCEVVETMMPRFAAETSAIEAAGKTAIA